jgi:hypothetical protein
MPPRELYVAPLGLGVDWTDQAVPFHTSARVSGRVLPYSPTAEHAVADVHDTLLNMLTVAPLGLEVDWTDHRDPFHLSARATGSLAVLRYCPTAVHALAEVHETAARWLD